MSKGWMKKVRKTIRSAVEDGLTGFTTSPFPKVTYPPAPPCHSGMTPVMTLEGESRGVLYAGGWSRGAEPDGKAVIDLTAREGEDVVWSTDGFARTVEHEAKFRNPMPWLNLYIEDFKAPYYDRELWVCLAQDVTELLANGTDVLVACMGGHGRTGTALSILCHMIGPDIVGDQPITWLREIHCKNAVESTEQVAYVYAMLGFTPPKMEEPAKLPFVSTYKAGSGVYTYKYSPAPTNKSTEGAIDQKTSPYLPGWSEASDSPRYWETWDMDRNF